ncbi:MAG: hypothetical protein Kow0077_18180 [Anaerolineae bacterium]
MKRALALGLILALLAGCVSVRRDFPTPTVEQMAETPAAPVEVAPTTTPVTLDELRSATPRVTMMPEATPTLAVTRLPVLLPTQADLGIVPMLVPTATHTPLPLPQPVIKRFLTPDVSVDALALVTRSAEVTLEWMVQNRAPGTNLVFEQVFPDGRVFNVERPRHFTAVPSEGRGTVAPFLPGGDARAITLRLRVIDTARRTTLTQAELRLSVVPLPEGPYETASGEACFQQPNLPSSGLSVGTRGVVSQEVLAGLPLTAISGVGGRVTGNLGRGETFTVVGGPFCFRVPESAIRFRQWEVRAEGSGQQGWAVEYSGTFTDYRTYLFPVRDVVIYPPDRCYAAPFLPDRGIRVGRGAVLAEGMAYGLSVFDKTGEHSDKRIIGDLPPDEIFTVIDGPHCYRIEPLPQTALGQRQWQVRSEVSGLTGWVYEYANERMPYILPAADGAASFEIRQFDVQPRTVRAGDPVTITWEVTGVNGVDVLMWHAALPTRYVSLAGSGVLLPLSGSLTVNAPEEVTHARFSLFGADSGGENGIEIAITCRYPWFQAGDAQPFCPSGPAQTYQAAYQPFEKGYMLWFDDQIWAVWGGSGAIYPDQWAGGDVVWNEPPPEGRVQPVRGFGTLWTTDENVRMLLGWATAPEQGYTLQIQQTAPIYRAGLRGSYRASDVIISLPDGGLLQVTRSGDHFSPRNPNS